MPRATILTTIAALIIFAIAAIVALVLVPHSSDSTPFLTAIVGLVAPTVVALVALLKIEETNVEAKATRKEVAEIHDTVNGVKAETDALLEKTEG